VSNIITLITDFGLNDPDVGVMKGVMLGISPQAVIVDISHAIEPQNIHQAAFVLSTAYQFFPQGTIHVVVVDPGVGSRRRAIILRTPSAYFVAPDNGVLSYILAPASATSYGPEPEERELGPELEAIVLTTPRFWRHPVSSTFHGRDIFAPVAASLSLGIPLHEFGEAVHSLLAFSPSRPFVDAAGATIGHIIYIDRFGNLITDVSGNDLPQGDVLIEICHRGIKGLSPSYAGGEELLALINSSGNLEIAAKNKSAAEMLKAKIGDEVRIKGGSSG
jgi:S-adenosylmethionine hydrolase